MGNNDSYSSPEDSTEEFISPVPIEGSATDPLISKKIGSCTIKRIIGSGGMGTVYEAVQDSPRRRVALKMMKRGITSRSATRRFEFESQTLARLKHQGVAQVYEAGTHDDGEGGVPYFVMEYVANAKPITVFAQEKKLGTRGRVDLFSKVCDAIQHGHLKGIVHRDLKPGNILVDSNGQPKIIDFGVARSTDSDLAITTLQTDVGQLIGTLQYMSPEQCEADPSDIDIRSDVYALGVILYELLTDNLPYDIRRVAIHEAVRIVREERPTRLSSLNKHLSGDIETIAHKALQKERDHRYQSATALKEDVLHYLNDEPINARPPGALDYIRRFVKKHTAAAISIASIFLILICAVFVISNYAVKVEKQRVKLAQEIERAEAVKEFVASMLSSVDPAVAGKMDKELMTHVLDSAADSIVEGFENQPLVEAELRKIIGAAYLDISRYADAKPHLQEAINLYNNHDDLVRINNTMIGISLHSLSARIQLGRLHYLAGDYAKSEKLLKESLDLSTNSLGEDHSVTLEANTQMADLLNRQGKYDESEIFINKVLSTQRKTLGNDHKKTISTLHNLGVVYFGQGKYDEALPCFRESLDAQQKHFGEEHPSTLNSMLNLGNVLFSMKNYVEAKPILLKVLDLNRQILGEAHPSTANTLNSVGALLKAQKKYDEALPYIKEAFEVSKRVSGEDHPKTLWIMGGYCEILAAQGNFSEAVKLNAQALETSRRVVGNTHPSTVFLIGNTGELLLAQEKYEEAEVMLLEYIESTKRNVGEDHPDMYWGYQTLAKMYEGMGKQEEAQKYRDKLPKSD
ncbi:MAG: serine/threonine protein kinase [Phycisphaerae bacterium]|nr:serine/threonine protein kinase [Phycisphaerae bacterium]